MNTCFGTFCLKKYANWPCQECKLKPAWILGLRPGTSKNFAFPKSKLTYGRKSKTRHKFLKMCVC